MLNYFIIILIAICNHQCIARNYINSNKHFLVFVHDFDELRILHRLGTDILRRVGCSCFLANTANILGCCNRNYNEETDITHDQAQIFAIFLWEEDLWQDGNPFY